MRGTEFGDMVTKLSDDILDTLDRNAGVFLAADIDGSVVALAAMTALLRQFGQLAAVSMQEHPEQFPRQYVEGMTTAIWKGIDGAMQQQARKQ